VALGEDFRKDLEKLINKHGIDSVLNTPDFVIADSLFTIVSCLGRFNKQRDDWWGFVPEIGNPRVDPRYYDQSSPFDACQSADGVIATLVRLTSTANFGKESSSQELRDDALKKIRELEMRRPYGQ
jgi:hypothetical protein